MKTNTRTLFLATSISALCAVSVQAGVNPPATAPRQKVTLSSKEEGVYIRLEAGPSFISGADVRMELPYGQGLDGRAKFKTGFVYGGAIGYRTGDVALECELDSTHNKFKSGPGDIAWSQSLRQLTLLGNAIWSCKLDGVSLELGGGLGAQFQNNNFHGDSSTDTGVLVAGDTLTNSFSKKSDTAFVGQLKAGISVPLDTRWSFNAGYKIRFLSESDLGTGELAYQASPTASVENYSSKLRLSSHYSHLLTAGFSYLF